MRTLTLNSIENNPYSLTKTGLLGDKRDTMLINEVIRKDKLGNGFLRGHAIPEDFVYGIPPTSHQFRVSDAMKGWPGLETDKRKLKSAKKERDFVAMNTAASQAGMVTVKEVNSFYKNHNISKKIPTKPQNRTNSFDSMVHGVKSRPSTPIGHVLEHKYQMDYITDMYKKQQKSVAKNGKTNKSDIYMTRTSLARQCVNPEESRELWQMSQFRDKAEAHVETFRSEKEKARAFKKHNEEKIINKGPLKLGIVRSPTY